MDNRALMLRLAPVRDGANIYVQDGDNLVRLTQMQANIIMRSWAEALGGAYVAQGFEKAHGAGEK